MNSVSHEKRIGRDVTIFVLAFGVSAAQNYVVRYFIGTNQSLRGNKIKRSDAYKRNFMKSCLSRGGNVRYEDCEDEMLADEEDRRQTRTISLDAFTKAAGANVGVGLLTIFAPMFGAYYAWDISTQDPEKYSSEKLLIPAITFGIITYLIHVAISSAARSRTHFEVWLYALVFALSSAGLSSLMHEFY